MEFSFSSIAEIFDPISKIFYSIYSFYLEFKVQEIIKYKTKRCGIERRGTKMKKISNMNGVL